MEAIERGNLSTIRQLIDGRADVNILAEGHTPLSLAVQRDAPDIIDMLVEAGSNVNFKLADGEYALTKVDERRGRNRNILKLMNAINTFLSWREIKKNLFFKKVQPHNFFFF